MIFKIFRNIKNKIIFLLTRNSRNLKKMANFFNQKVKTLFTRFDSDKVSHTLFLRRALNKLYNL